MRARLRAGARSTFSSLRVRNFRLFFAGQLVSQVGNWLTTVALTLLVLHRTHSGLAIGVLVACQFAPLLVLGPWAGLIADRADKRRLLLVTQALEMAQSGVLAALAFLHAAPLLAFYGTALAGGFMLAFDNPARRSFVPELVSEDQVQNAVSLNSALMNGSRIVGPALAGLLVITVGYGWGFAGDAASYLAVLLALWMIRPPELYRSPAAPRGRGQIREGLRYVRATPELFVPLAMLAIIGTLTFNFSVVMPLLVERTLHGSDASFTLMYSVLSVGALLGALGAARRRTVDIRMVVVAAAGFGAAMLVFGSVPGLAAGFVVAAVVGFTSVSFMTLSTAIVQVRAHPAMRGRVIALQSMLLLGTTPFGGPLLGVICDAFGARAGVALGGLAALVAAGLGFVAGRRVTTYRMATSPVVALEEVVGSEVDAA
ncbi:MAG TPA: MFS transporter [Actinomycetota bacterium]|nr:MFS transporter [Actinomycetota bacterium]